MSVCYLCRIGRLSTHNIVGTDHQRIAKLDRENEVAPPAKIAPSVGKAIQTARQEKQFTQKDLAQKVNEKPSVIQDYESSKAIPNPQILSKLERALGVKLRGACQSASCYSRLMDLRFASRAQVATLERSWRGRRRRKLTPP